MSPDRRGVLRRGGSFDEVKTYHSLLRTRSAALPGRAYPSGFLHRTRDSVKVFRFSNHFIHAVIAADEPLDMRGVDRGQHELAPKCGWTAAEMLEPVSYTHLTLPTN